jgi:succinate dehydrogenase flavin-adding protein (antitoxin of CptAB toxin-antitoxin module)
MSVTAYRTLKDHLAAKDNQIAEVCAGMKELDPGRRQEMVDYVQELLEEQRTTKA